MTSLRGKLLAEGLGSLLLLATVVGSGVMGTNLSQGNPGSMCERVARNGCRKAWPRLACC